MNDLLSALVALELGRNNQQVAWINPPKAPRRVARGSRISTLARAIAPRRGAAAAPATG